MTSTVHITAAVFQIQDGKYLCCLFSRSLCSKEYSEVLEAVLSLPEKYKDVIYLHYYEGYSAYEIGTILKKKENTVYSLLSRGRGILREILGGEQFEG